MKTKWNVSGEDFKPRGKRGEQDKHTQKAESEIIKLYPNGEVKLYPKGEVMTITRTQESEGPVERKIGKTRIQEEKVDQVIRKNIEEETRKREEDEKMRWIIKEHEEGMAKLQLRIQELEREERRLKEGKEEEEKIVFFSNLEASAGGKK